MISWRIMKLLKITWKLLNMSWHFTNLQKPPQVLWMDYEPTECILKRLNISWRFLQALTSAYKSFKSLLKYSNIFANLQRPLKVLWGFQKLLKALWSLLGYPGTSKKSLQILWNFWKFFQTSLRFIKLFEIFKYLWRVMTVTDYEA